MLSSPCVSVSFQVSPPAGVPPRITCASTWVKRSVQDWPTSVSPPSVVSSVVPETFSESTVAGTAAVPPVMANSVESVVPSVLMTTSATPSAVATRVSRPRALTFSASAAATSSAVWPAATSWLNTSVSPPTTSVRVQNSPTSGVSARTTVLASSVGQADWKVTV